MGPPMSADLSLLNARASGRVRDLHVVAGVLSECAAADAEVVDLDGAEVVPGWHDHHVHLAAAAAAIDSLSLAPDVLDAGGGLAEVLRTARRHRPTGWLRGIGYDLAQSGWIDRRDLDSAQVGPVRVQDRTGARWVLDSAGLAGVLEVRPWPDGVERDAAGHPTGHLVRLDSWLREQLPVVGVPDWAGLGRVLAAQGVTSVTDAGHLNDWSTLQMLDRSALPQRIRAMTAEPLLLPEPVDRVVLDAVKIVLDDEDLPALEELRARLESAHAVGRHVAVHCVTDVQLALALSAGLGPGDRIEHANVVPDGYADLLAESGVTVCVQPALLHARGDRYLDEVEPDRWHELFRLRSLVDAGVPLLGGSDAPVGPTSPRLGVWAAVTRSTQAGRILCAEQALTAPTAASLFRRSATRGWPLRTLRPGEPADLLVLGSADPVLAEVLATVISGVVAHGAL